jgi:hypothetical protein
MSSTNISVGLVKQAECVVDLCKNYYIPPEYESNASIFDSWRVQFGICAHMIEKYIGSSNERVLESTVRSALVNMRCFQIICKKKMIVSPWVFIKAEGDIWRMINDIKNGIKTGNIIPDSDIQEDPLQ